MSGGGGGIPVPAAIGLVEPMPKSDTTIVHNIQTRPLFMVLLLCCFVLQYKSTSVFGKSRIQLKRENCDRVYQSLAHGFLCHLEKRWQKSDSSLARLTRDNLEISICAYQ